MDNVKMTPARVIMHIFLILLSLCFILPFILIISASFTNEDALIANGYTLIPSMFDIAAYKYVFSNPTEILDAYQVTAFASVVGTFLSLCVMSMCAYAISKKQYRWRRGITFYVYFTTLFSGGMVPSYILITQYLGLGNNIWVYILPSLASPFYIIILRTFFAGIPGELSEAAKIDGCSEFKIFFSMILPLSKPALATIGLLTLLTKWNDWQTSMLYIRDEELYTLQYLLQRILNEVEFLKNLAQNQPAGIDINVMNTTPSESMRFAMCVVAAGPMLVVFPFFQRYFTRGLTVGAVKG